MTDTPAPDRFDEMAKVQERLSEAAEAARPNHWGNRIHYFDADDVEAILAENAKLRARLGKLERLVQVLLDNDPDDMAADAVTVFDVWRADAVATLNEDKP